MDAAVEVPCPDCRTTSLASDLGPGSCRCHRCKHAYFLRRCAVCDRVSHVSSRQQWHQFWKCLWCRESNPDFTRAGDPAAASIAEFAADVENHTRALPTVRRVKGSQPEPVRGARPARSTGSVWDVKPPRSARPGPAGEPARPARSVWDAKPPRPAEPARPAGPVRTITIGGFAADRAGAADHAATMDRPWAWDPSHGQAASRAGARRPLRIAVIAAVLVIAGVLAAVLVAHAAPGGIAGLGADGLGGAGGLGGVGGRSRPVSVTALQVARVDLRGVPGQLIITGTGAGPVTLTGQLRWHGQAPVAVVRLNPLTHVLRLSYRCAAASPCTGNYRLTVPGRTATVLDLPSGHLVVLGVAGPLRITAGRADVTAAGLRSPVLSAAITSGHLSASFDRPPRRISMVLTSAQATLRLPGSVAYRVSQDMTAGFVRVAIPHTATAARSVTARIASGELELLTSHPAVSR